jgi:chromosome segregation ATPase
MAAEAEAVGPLESTGVQGCDARTMQVLEFGGVEGWAQEVQRLRVELSVCKKERDEAVQSVAVAQHAHQKLGIELSSWLASFEKICGEMKDKQAEASAMAKELKAYQAQLKQATVDRDEAIKSLGEANALLEQSKQNILEDKMENENYIKELLDVVMFDLDTLRDALSAELNTSHQNNLRKENCIKALTDLRTCLETQLDALRRQRMGLIQEHNNVVDAQQQEIETLLAISQQDNLGKEKDIQELHGNLEELTEELGALRQT